ncbi:hypothetical protein [Roseovarius sp. 2305UL8-3]|uniref:hypothetical protein n=1 Tax=Roseovarius conchicola TaxID=3121636 RepID=UPI0035283179
MSQLETYLREFDGVAVSALSEARVAFRDAEGYLDEVIALCGHEEQLLSQGATWILKAELEDGAKLSPQQVSRVMAVLQKVTAWQAALHLCQCLDRLDLDPNQAQATIAWASSYSGHPRPFLRAWSLHVQVMLGCRVKTAWPHVRTVLEEAEHDTAASVRARARKLRALKQVSAIL